LPIADLFLGRNAIQIGNRKLAIGN